MNDERVNSRRGKKLVVELVLAWLVTFQAPRSGLAGARCEVPVGYRVGSSWQRLELELPESQTPQRHYHHTRIDGRRRTRGSKRGRKAMCSSDYE